MLISQEIEVTYQADPGEEGVAWPTLTLKSDGKRLAVDCDCCGVRRAYRFLPTDQQGSTIDYCIECMIDMSDVLKIVIGPQD